MKKFSHLFIFATVILLSFNSCVKKDFDSPPDVSSYDPQLPVNMTIAQLKAKFPSTTPQRIDSNWTVYGIVNADDRSGNFYKQINIEDSTGGITILIDAYSLYNKYPVGRKVYVNLKGLYFGYYAKLAQLGFAPDYTGSLNSIPGTAVDKYIVRANFPNEVPVTKFTGLAALKTVNVGMLNRLVQIDSVEIIATDLSKTYSDSLAATSITIEDCAGNKIILRTSNFANFHALQLPQGKGRITALYTTYNSTPQLVIRDTSDLQFYGTRCDGATPGNGAVISIDSVRKFYSGTDVTLGNFKMKGVVISSAAQKNVSAGNIVVQDGNKGITVYYGSSTPNADLGDSVLIDLTGLTLTSFQGALEIKTATAAKTSVVASGKTVTPAQVTIATLVNNWANYESTLVKIINGTISGGGTYSGNKTLSDGSGSTIILYTATAATFATQPVPTTPMTFVGIVSPFNATKELKLRNPATDVY